MREHQGFEKLIYDEAFDPEEAKHEIEGKLYQAK
jgi:hypothetical protein